MLHELDIKDDEIEYFSSIISFAINRSVEDNQPFSVFLLALCAEKVGGQNIEKILHQIIENVVIPNDKVNVIKFIHKANPLLDYSDLMKAAKESDKTKCYHYLNKLCEVAN